MTEKFETSNAVLYLTGIGKMILAVPDSGSVFKKPYRLKARMLPSQGMNAGSIPTRATKFTKRFYETY